MDRWEKIRQFINKEMEGEPVAGPDHLERAYGWSKKIGEKKGANPDVLLTAALLHDIGVPVDRKRHYEAGLPKAEAFLKELGDDPEAIQQTLHVIQTHSRYGGPDPESLEAKILQDVDAIEYVGAVGLVRGLVRALREGSFNGDVSQVPALIDHLIERVGERFYTEEVAAVIRKRMEYLKSFSAQLKKELDGEA